MTATPNAFASVDGHRCTSVTLHVANIGPWHAECDFEDAPTLGTSVVLELGALQLHGTVFAQQDGTFGQQRKTRIVAGGGGWGRSVTAKAYHNDAGVKARHIAEDAAREVGEEIGDFIPVAERVGVDYARQVGPASRTLEDTIGAGIAWWVDYDGITNVGPRPSVALDANAYEVLSYDPRARIATLAIDDPTALVIGTEIAGSLDAVQTVREFTLRVDAEAMRVTAWLGGSGNEPGRLATTLRAIIGRATDSRLDGVYRYRVVRMAGDGRVDLQAVQSGVGLPDLRLVSQWPGVAGVHAELAPGAIVLVAFIEGDRTLPIITQYAGENAPVSLVICGVDGAPAARSGDAVDVLLPPAVFTGTIAGSPVSGLPVLPSVKLAGTITAGSSRAKIST